MNGQTDAVRYARASHFDSIDVSSRIEVGTDGIPSLLVHRLGLALLLALAVHGLVGGDEVLLALALLLLLLELLLLHALLLRYALLRVAANVVLAGLELEIHLAGLRGGREGRVRLLLADPVRLEALAETALLVVGEEAVPGFILQ